MRDNTRLFLHHEEKHLAPTQKGNYLKILADPMVGEMVTDMGVKKKSLTFINTDDMRMVEG